MILSFILLITIIFYCNMRICKSLLLSSKSLSSLSSFSSLISIKRYIPIVNNNNNYYYNDYCTKLRSISTSSGKGFAEKIDNNNNNINLIKPNNSDSNNNENNNRKKPEDWDLKGLKAETSRVYLRIFKKIGKASERLSKGKEFYNNNNNLKELENYSNISELENELKILQDTLVKVSRLEERLKGIRSNKDNNFIKLVEDAIELNINDEPPPKQERGESKQKGKPSPPRKPYFIYNSNDNINIRVGRAAPDNDELSCNPEHRDNNDWWLHVAGFAGSHVVIRYTDDDLVEKFKETVLDAAMLAAVNSKAPQSGKIPVSLTRCRYVSKPSGAKAGLVRLNGDVMTIKIDVKANQARLDRLNLTKE